MSAKSKIRGYNHEISIRDKHAAAGIGCERVPLSGSMGGKYTGDLCVPSIEHREFILECKARKNGSGFKVIEDWIEDADILFMRRNNQEDLVVMRMDLYMKLMKRYYSDVVTGSYTEQEFILNARP